MNKFRFTGNPFVDAGIAGLCAAAGVSSSNDLDEAFVKQAVSTLISLLTNDAAYKERVIDKKKKVFATSDMSIIFPNGPHANPSGKPNDKSRKYKNKVNSKYFAWIENKAGTERCFVSGATGCLRVGNDEFPLVDSKGKRNFHPEHQEGRSISASVALALEFFPLSVLRTGVDAGLYWFVHTGDERLAIECARLTLERMNTQVAQRNGLGFFGDWRVASRSPDAAFVALIRDVSSSSGKSKLKSDAVVASEFPITAYVFSNDNRSPEISAQDLPHSLFRYFNALRGGETASARFQSEVLLNEYACWRVARAMLQSAAIVRPCCVPAQQDKPARLRGGWEAHSLYATEVLRMSGAFIRAIEAVSTRVVDSDNQKKVIQAFSHREAVPSVEFLRLVKQKLITEEEFLLIVPPESRGTAFAARDYLLAALFEHENAQAQERSFLTWPGEVTEDSDTSCHPTLQVTERIGAQILAADRAKALSTTLAKVNRTNELRAVFLHFVRRGYATYDDFIYLFPPEQEKALPAFPARDYLLAYLYSRMKPSELADAASDPTTEGVPA